MRKTVISHQLSVISLLLFVLSFNAFAQTPKETPPPPSEPPTLSIPEVKEMTLENGLKVAVVQKTGLPLVTVSLLVKCGADCEPDSKAGLANMTANLLIKGTKYRTATDIAEQIDFLGGSLNSGVGWNSSTVTLNVLKDKLGKSLSIMSDSVIRPAFPAKEVQLAKKQTLDGFKVSLKQPGTLLAYVASRYTYKEHPSVGTTKTIGKITRKDIVGFHKTKYTPTNSVLIFTGDISPDQANRFAKLFFGSWTGKREPQKTLASVADSLSKRPATIKRMLVVDLPNSGQAAVGFANKLGFGRKNSTTKYFPASVLNSVLGGGYSARLNQEIRLKRGLSYGARSGFSWRADETNFNANTQTKNESAAQVAELIKIEINKLANDSIKETELIPRKAVITGGFGRGLQTNNGLAARLRDLYLYDLSPNELNSFMNNVRNVSDQQIKDFASNNLLGGDMIIVGDAKMFMEDLKKRFPNQKIEVIKASDLNLNSSNLKKR